MQETLHISSAAVPINSPVIHRPRSLHVPVSKSVASTPKPLLLKYPGNDTVASSPQTENSQIQELLLYLDSLGIDSLHCLTTHPQLISSPLAQVKSTVDYLFSLGLSIQNLRRIFPMCPELLTSSTAEIVIPAADFLLREVLVKSENLPYVIHRRPRLLTRSVDHQLRPTLYFLQGSIGIEDMSKWASLLSSSVENKFIPKIEYLQKLGFPYRDTIKMFRRFPPLFCYSIEDNFEPKFDYFVMEMGRELKELVEFPQYFSFSLEKRIKQRHRMCVDRGVCLKLPTMLKLPEGRFLDRLEICIGSSSPVRNSPLWSTNSNSEL